MLAAAKLANATRMVKDRNSSTNVRPKRKHHRHHRHHRSSHSKSIKTQKQKKLIEFTIDRTIFLVCNGSNPNQGLEQFSTDDGEETMAGVVPIPTHAPVTSINNHCQKVIHNPIHVSPSINSDDSEMIPMSKSKIMRQTFR